MKNKLMVVTDVQPYRIPSKFIESIIGKWKHCYHIIKVLPLIKKLIKDNKNEVTIVGLNADIKKILLEKKIDYKNQNDYMDAETYKKMYEDTMFLIRKLPGLKGEEYFKKLTTYQDIWLWDLEEFEIYEYLFWILENIIVVKRAIENENPAQIIVINGKDPAGETAVILGETYKILTYVQNGMIENFKYRVMKILSPYATKFLMPSAAKQLRKCRRKRLKTEGFSHKLNKVLILVDNPRFTTLTIPIIKELMKNPMNEVIVVGLDDSAKGKYEPENISYKTFRDYVDVNINKLVNKAEESLKRNWDNLRDDKNFKQSLIYQKVPVWELIEDLVLFIFRTRFVELIEYIEILKRAIDIEKPDIIIVWDDRSRFGKTVVATAHLKKIPSLIVMHGIIFDTSIITGAPDSGPTLADNMAVFGQYTKDCLIRSGVSPEKIVVTGSPMHDRIVKMKFDKEKICSQLGIDKDKKIVVFTTQPMEHIVYTTKSVAQERLVREIIKSLKNLSDVQLVIKLHPAENGKMHKRIVKEMIANAVIIKDVDIYELLNASDLLLTETSTTALEAMLVEKPVIIINLDNKPEMIPFVRSGAAIGVYKPENIVSAVKDALYNEDIRKKLAEKRKRFVYEQAYMVDGKAAERVVNLIKEMIKKTREKRQK